MNGLPPEAEEGSQAHSGQALFQFLQGQGGLGEGQVEDLGGGQGSRLLRYHLDAHAGGKGDVGGEERGAGILPQPPAKIGIAHGPLQQSGQLTQYLGGQAW